MFTVGCAQATTIPSSAPVWTLVPQTTVESTQTTSVAPVDVTNPVSIIVPPADDETPASSTTSTLPPWTGNIHEEYGPDTGCTPNEATRVAAAMRNEGANNRSIEWMLYVISRESLCDPAAHNGDRSTGDDSWGLCQINNLAGFYNSDGILADYDRFAFATDFDLNAQACARLWAVCGRGPWTKGDYGCRTPQELR